MKKFSIGDIVYVSRYKYKSGEMGTNHFLVIIDDGQAIEIDSYFGFLVTSNQEKIKYKYNKRLNKNIRNHLIKDSIVKCDDLIEISDEEIVFKVGEVEQSDLKTFLNTYMRYLDES